MKSKHIITLVLVVVAVGLLGVSSLYAQEKMKYEDYLVELQKWQEREAAAKLQIDQLQSEIDDLRSRIADTEKQTADTKAEMWRGLQTSEQGFKTYVNNLNRLRSQMNGLANLNPGDLYKRKDEATALKERLDEFKSSPAANHPDAVVLIRELENLLGRLEEAVENAVPDFDMYTVERGDFLFRISGKQDIYGDPYQWLKIWSKNRDLIKNPDLIYPDWKLKIPRGLADNEHLVVRGENLSKIAGYSNVYNDPFKWMRLYEANNTIITDPNVIYPHMIIIKP